MLNIFNFYTLLVNTYSTLFLSVGLSILDFSSVNLNNYLRPEICGFVQYRPHPRPSQIKSPQLPRHEKNARKMLGLLTNFTKKTFTT
jgi:hypothetical protein